MTVSCEPKAEFMLSIPLGQQGAGVVVVVGAGVVVVVVGVGVVVVVDTQPPGANVATCHLAMEAVDPAVTEI